MISKEISLLSMSSGKFCCQHIRDTITQDVIKAINAKLSIDIKVLGVINRFICVDIEQTQDFIKIQNRTYIEKILSVKGWVHADIPANKNSKYSPTHNDQTYNAIIEETSPIPTEELASIEK